MLLQGRWEIDEESARSGGQAAVYKAFDLQDQCHVAVKRLFGSVYDDEATRESFNRELQALYRLSHPNIVRVLDHGRDDDDRPFVVLEWLERNLADEFQYGAFESWSNFSEVGIPILRGLAFAHSQNQLHRDLKPDNILFAADDSPRIADFGISKIVDTLLSNNVTFAAYGTFPYSAPEMEVNAGTHVLSRDVYAFAVLSLEAIAGRRFRDRAEVEENIGLCDSEPDAAEFFHAALDEDPSTRPRSASEALAILEPGFNKWQKGFAERRRPTFCVSLGITTTVAQVVSDRTGIPIAGAKNFVLEDLNDCAKFAAERGTDGQDDCLIAATQSFKYKLILPDEPKGSLLAVHAVQLPASRLQDFRDAAWDGAQVNFVLGNSHAISAPAKCQDGLDLYDQVVEFSQAVSAQDRFDEQKTLFEGWRRLLRAKKRIEEERGTALRFANRSVSGHRVTFEVREKTQDELIGQPRYVKIEGGLRIRGEITEVDEKQVVLYVERGEPSEIPATGELLFDADAAMSALKAQENALDVVQYAKSACPHLGEIIAYPDRAKAPWDVQVEEFIQENLDEAKQDCVRRALGSDELMIVEGPPGTGKTTFIAELALQFLRKNPSGRILLASQTHVALDNALERIRRLEPTRRLLRLGREGKMADSVVDLSVYPQLRDWRRQALSSGREYLRRLAEEHGLDPSALEISHIARSYRDAERLLKDARSRLQLQRDELRLLKDELGELDLFMQMGLEPDTVVDTGLVSANPTVEIERRSGIQQQIAEGDETISNIASQVDQRKQDLETRQCALAKALGRSPETESADLLLEAAGFEVEDKELRGLYDLHLEWEKRCGIGNEFISGLVARAEVVAGTCVGVASTAARGIQFDLCIVDEASKATPTETLIPMSLASASVLVGDRNQLPPFNEEVLNDPELMRRFNLHEIDLNETLFDRLSERLVGNQVALTHQHRMVPEIGGLISECFYDGRLTSEPRERDSKLSMLLPQPVVWYSTSNMVGRKESRHGTSYANDLESRLILHLLESISSLAKLAKRRFSVAVLTGYGAQRVSIERRVSAAAADFSSLDLMINSVDAFQGQEADICVFSMTRSNGEGRLGFLKESRRINVALSRGREALVIVGDSDLCIGSPEMPNPMFDVLAYVDRSEECVVSEGADLL